MMGKTLANYLPLDPSLCPSEWSVSTQVEQSFSHASSLQHVDIRELGQLEDDENDMPSSLSGK